MKFLLFLIITGVGLYGAGSKEDTLLDKSNRVNDSLKIIELQEIGNSFVFTKPDSALFYYNAALDIANKINLSSEIAKIYSRIGGAKYIMGEYDFALENTLKALRLWEKEGNKKGIAIGLNDIGIIQNMQEKIDEAILNHKKSIQICRELGDSLLWARNLHNIGIAFNTGNKYDSALFYADKSIGFYDSIDVYFEKLKVYNLKGEIFIKKHNYDRAVETYLAVINQPDYNNKWEICYALAGLADAEKHLGNNQKSIDYAMRSYKIAKEIQAKWDLQKVTGILAETYARLEKWDSAYKYLLLYKTYNDSIFNEEKEKEINYLQLKRKQEENELLAAENQIKQQRIERKNTVIYIIVSGSVLLCIIVFVLYRNNILKTRLNRELEKKSKIIAEKNKELTDLNTTKDRIFRIISHDLKSPVSTLVSFTDLLKDDYERLNEKTVIEIVNNISRTSREGLYLLENLLDWARSQTGSIAYNPKNIKLRELVNEALELYGGNASVKKINIDIEITDDLFVYADRNMTSIILRNLISNAIKYTPNKGNISIIAERNDMVKVSIIDNGIGIKKEDISKLFQVDEQYTMPGTNDEKGTGLGLLICKEFTEKQGGIIQVKSEPGKGSRFSFTLPCKS